jgi:hypothetical protein
MSHATRYNLDNVDNGLVATKNSMIARIDTATMPPQLHSVLDHLCDCLKLWRALRYNYKGSELCERIEKRALELTRKYEDQDRWEWRSLVERARIVDEFHRDEKANQDAFPMS